MSDKQRNQTRELLDAVKAVPKEAKTLAIAYLQGMAAMAAAKKEVKQ